MRVSSTVLRGRVAHARVLESSLRAHHPDVELTLLAFDADVADDLRQHTNAAILTPNDVSLDVDILHTLPLLCDPISWDTFTAPWLLRELLRTGSGPVAYIDVRSLITGDISELFTVAREHGLALVPRADSRSIDDGRTPSASDFGIAGVLDNGTFAVDERGTAVLVWMIERLNPAIAPGLADPRDEVTLRHRQPTLGRIWLDALPAIFPHAFPGESLVASAWAMDTSAPVFRFESLDPTNPILFDTRFTYDPRALLSSSRRLLQITTGYAQQLLAASFAPMQNGAGTLQRSTSDILITDRIRRIFRDAWVRFEAGFGNRPPDPFDAEDPLAFVEWLNSPAFPDQTLSRFMMEVWCNRRDLMRVFPDPHHRDAEAFHAWAHANGHAEESIPDALMPVGEHHDVALPGAPSRSLSSQIVPGAAVAGFFTGSLGLGVAARSLVTGLDAANIPYATVNYSTPTILNKDSFDHSPKSSAAFDTNIICVNATETADFASKVGPAFFEGRYSIGLWFWEVAAMPPGAMEAVRYLDEVWVTSEYVADIVREHVPLPVYVLPLPVEQPKVGTLERASLGIPNGHMFLFSFDFNSTIERKNPLGLIDAFTRAFAPGEGPVLVIKSINGDNNIEALETVRQAAIDRDDIVIIDGYLPVESKDGLMASCDTYVSLHRSEGFGLTMAEAMLLGKPVIGTGFSGNLHFMDERNSFLVRHDMSTVPASAAPPYVEGAAWSEPDLNHAADLMRDVWTNPDQAREVAVRGQRDVLDRCSAERCGQFIAGRLEAIRNERRASRPRTRAVRSATRRVITGYVVPFSRRNRTIRKAYRAAVRMKLVHSREPGH